MDSPAGGKGNNPIILALGAVAILALPAMLMLSVLTGGSANAGPNPYGTQAQQSVNLADARHLSLINELEKYVMNAEYLTANAATVRTDIQASATKLRQMLESDPILSSRSDKAQLIKLLDELDAQTARLVSAEQGTRKDASSKIIAAIAALKKAVSMTDQSFPLRVNGKNPSYTSTYGAPRPEGRSHRGTDLMTPIGTDVIAVADGTIVRAGCCDAWGKQKFTIKPDAGSQEYFYAHVINMRVKNGDRVAKGQVIAQSGSANNAPHLHFGIKVPCDTPGAGRERANLSTCWIDPVPFLKSIDPRK